MLSPKADGKMAKAGLMPKTTNERQKEFTKRQKELGRTKKAAYLTESEWRQVQKYINDLRQREK